MGSDYGNRGDEKLNAAMANLTGAVFLGGSLMTNEIDLHAANHVPASGLGRSLVYYYFVLILSVPVILFGITNTTLKFGILALMLSALVAPPVYVLRKKRRLRALRQAQVTALRKRSDE